MSNNKYWQSFGELNNSEAFQKAAKDEFKEELPFEAEENSSFLHASAPRRDFLKYLGFSTAAAAIAASCEIPVKKAIPFANKPEDIVPGVANYYATTYVQDGDVVSVLAKVRDGRPIKIEGNDLSNITYGGTSARVQASVLDLYDSGRLRFPTIDGKEVTLEAVDKAVNNALNGLGGAPVVLLTSTINSPCSLEVVNQFLAKYPGSKHVMYDAISYSGMLLANEATFGKRAIPVYNFDKASVIVSIGADFLGTWLSPVEFAKQYSEGKRINAKNPSMLKHVHFETLASLTGSNADDRFLHRPSETGLVVSNLLNALNGQAVSGVDGDLKKGIEGAAKLLSDNKGKALVVCGSNDKNIQILVNAINNSIQSYGTTIDWSATLNYKLAVDSDFAQLLDDMNAGSVGAVIVHSVNPAYTWVDSKKVQSAFKKVRFAVSISPRNDETAQLCKYVIPDNHYLESWGDAEPRTGSYSLMQPTIYPLFKTRQWQDSLLKWSGATVEYVNFVKNYWTGKLGSEENWDRILQAGLINSTPVPASAGTFSAASVAQAASDVAGYKKSSGLELVLYQKVSVGVNGATNPWLQEMPDPVSRATWDNYLIVSPSKAKTLLNIDLTVSGQADSYEVNPMKKVVSVSVNGTTITVPALIIPGTHPETVGLALGYGRTPEVGKTAANVGQNAFPFTSFINGSVSLTIPSVDVKLTDDLYKVALTQTHSTYDTAQGKRVEVMKELTLSEFIKAPNEIPEDREEELKPFGGIEKFDKLGTIYPYYDKPGIHWGMGVDLNTCTGCGACVIACHAENNVPVVGKSEVARFHDMHWLRIDRYYSGSIDNPQVVFQPMMCQHCDNAPCENVCPVAATNHSSEGLNQMTYNRCIGTRYCANNCPYKVRRFNWADYTGADSFPDNQDQQIVGHLDDVVHVMNDDLSRMVLNPDVTVRSRGVIEKCSFCVQRLQEGKLKAKKAGRPLKTGADGEWDLKTACQQACPTNAIVFGNVNDSKSAISVHRAENFQRTFYSLEPVHTLPNVSYLAKVRNRKEETEHSEG